MVGSYIENENTGGRIEIRYENCNFIVDNWAPSTKNIGVEKHESSKRKRLKREKQSRPRTPGAKRQTVGPNRLTLLTEEDEDADMDTDAVFVRRKGI